MTKVVDAHVLLKPVLCEFQIGTVLVESSIVDKNVDLLEIEFDSVDELSYRG